VEKPKQVAVIDEGLCIGCTLCTQACPVDAIVGAAKQMHTIVAPLCTGCELCVPPCPVDCIAMVQVPETVETWKWKYPVIPIREKAA
jgi:electron transport complex protein RnfB